MTGISEISKNIEVNGVSKRYPGRHVNALVDVNLKIAPGKLVAILGPSGCGKSTLLNLLGGIDSPSEGSIAIGEAKLSDMSDDQLTEFRLKELGFVFQFFNLLPTFTVEENVSLPLEMAGRDPGAVRESVASLLDRVGLAERSGFMPSQLSGGEMQRTAVARAIVHKPRLVLADEPTGNLDTENGAIVLDLLRQINIESGITIIMATHSLEAAAKADLVIKMRDGKVVDQES